MSLTKKQRQQVFEKYGEKCAYCGCELKKGWHADHIKPVERHIITKKMLRADRDVIENINPSCPSCNIHKHSLTLEQFREQIAYHIEAMNKRSTQYKFLKKFGLIKETGEKVVFYFEKVENDQ